MARSWLEVLGAGVAQKTEEKRAKEEEAAKQQQMQQALTQLLVGQPENVRSAIGGLAGAYPELGARAAFDMIQPQTTAKPQIFGGGETGYYMGTPGQPDSIKQVVPGLPNAGRQPSTWEQKMNALVEQGVPRETALGIAAGVYKTRTRTDPVSKETVTEIIDLRSGQPIGSMPQGAGQSQGQPYGQAAPMPQPVEEVPYAGSGVPPYLMDVMNNNGGELPPELANRRGEITLDDAAPFMTPEQLQKYEGQNGAIDLAPAVGYSGAVGRFGNAIANIFAPNLERLPFEEVKKAGDAIDRLAYSIISVDPVGANGRPSKWAMEINDRLARVSTGIVQGDKGAKIQLEGLRDFMEDELEVASKLAYDSSQSPTTQGDNRAKSAKVSEALKKVDAYIDAFDRGTKAASSGDPELDSLLDKYAPQGQ